MSETYYNQINPEQAAMEARISDLEAENRKLKAGRVFGVVLAIGSVAAAIYCGKKLKDVMGVVNSAVTDVSNLTYIDVQQAVVDKAVERAAQNAAGKAVKATENLMRDTVSAAVTNAVSNSKGQLKSAVTEKIACRIVRKHFTSARRLIANAVDTWFSPKGSLEKSTLRRKRSTYEQRRTS